MTQRSITFRLALYFGAVSTAALLVLGVQVGMFVERHFVDLDRIELRGKIELVRHVLAKARTPADIEALPERLADALVGHETLSVRVATLDGRTVFVTQGAMFPEALAKTGRDDAPSAEPQLASWEHNGHGYRGLSTYARTQSAELPYAVITAAVTTDEHHKFMAAFYESLWLAIGSGIVSIGLLGWVAAKSGLAPLREMTRVAQRITASRLDDRLPTTSLPVELRDLATAFNEMLSRLQDSFRRLSEFSSDLAHELRTPIANMMTQTQVVLSRTRSADEYREVLYSISEEFDRLARMISDMLFLAKADNGQIVPRSAIVDLAAEVRELFEFYDALAEDRGVGMALIGEGTVSGERLMIRRAISNLLSNAINHTPRGGRVDVRIEQTDAASVRLAVENPGDGIAAEHLPRLFDRFYRVDPSRLRSTEGAGLGLAITKSIVTAHRGTVSASSADGLTRIEISLPAR